MGYKARRCTHFLLTLLMHEELEMLQSMVTDEDLGCWFANQKLLYDKDVTHIHAD